MKEKFENRYQPWQSDLAMAKIGKSDVFAETIADFPIDYADQMRGNMKLC